MEIIRSYFEDFIVILCTALALGGTMMGSVFAIYSLVTALPIVNSAVLFALALICAFFVWSSMFDMNTIKRVANDLKAQNKLLKTQINILELNNEEFKKSNDIYKNNNNLLNIEVNIMNANNEELKDQVKELSHLLENSKKLVTNLVLAGDDYKKFNKKFGANLTTLGQTSTDLKTTAKSLNQLVSKMTNSIAKQNYISPNYTSPDLEVSLDCDDLPKKKKDKLIKTKESISRISHSPDLIY